MIAVSRYYALAKPGIIMGNGLTAFAGFALASKGHFDQRLFFTMLIGLSAIIGSGCVFNNLIDRAADALMVRTRNRPLVQGVISPNHAILYASVLASLGSLILFYGTNLLTLLMALIGLFVYVVLYSNLKYRSVHGTLVGSIAGAMPPVVGYCGVMGKLDLCALILFLMLICWQMPHFYAIAIYRLGDYEAAAIPVLPLVKGLRATQKQMLFYIMGFMAIAPMLTVFHFAGKIYLFGIATLGFIWCWLSVQGFRTDNSARWARGMFLYSLIVILGLCLLV